MSFKTDAMRRLVAKRRLFRFEGSPLTGYRHVQDFADGQYDGHDYVVPWSISACNLNAKVMLVAQDWASANFLEKPFDPEMARLGHDARLHSNRNLFRLLREHLKLEFAETFATDTIPFVKPGAMDTRIDLRAFDFCAREFLVPQIEIVRPKLVILIGKGVYDSLCRVHRIPCAANINAAIEHPLEINGIATACVAHTGARGTNTRGSDRVERDWARLKDLL